MKHSFTLTMLAGQRALVTGDRPGQETVLDAKEWLSLQDYEKSTHILKDFDDAVTTFFDPLVAAAEKFEEFQAIRDARLDDPAFVVVVQEGTECCEPGTPPKVVHLGEDAAIIRMIELGDTDRLIWVGDRIEIRARD